MKKWLLAALALVVLAGAGTYAAVWYREQTETKIVRGSPTVEFETTEGPAEEERPAKVVKRTPWPRYGYDLQRTHVAADFDHRPPYRDLWFVETGDYIEFPPAVADGRLFVANQKGAFLAIGTERGKVLWRKRWPRCIAAGPAVSGNLVYLSVMNPIPCNTRENRAAQRGFVLAMNVKTGKIRWRFDGGAMESSPLVVGKFVYFGSWDHKVYAVDARTGKVRWSYDTGEEINSSATYDEGRIFIGTNGGHVYALNAWTGKLAWRASSFARFGQREYFYATPTVAYGRVYIGNTDGTLYAFGAKSGNLLWARPAGTYVYTAAAVWKNRVYIGTYDGRFAAFDAGTGDLVWRWDAPGAIHGAPTVMAGLVYFSTAAGFATPKAKRYIHPGRRGTYALDARTGKLVWRRRGVGLYSPITADDERVYLTGATRVYALEPKRGEKGEKKKSGAKKDPGKKKQTKKKRDRGEKKDERR